jgi:hypothetical protein
MGKYKRSIKIAFDRNSKKILDADELFSETKDAFQVRMQYNAGIIELECCECEQDLTVSGSKFDRLHFKHKPNHAYCILSDGNLTPKEQDDFCNILRRKESDRHIELKNKIGKLLRHVDGVDASTIAIDDKFIIRGDQKRRPDVYCKFEDKELVFEIQLSDLSLKYILSRYDFYKEHKMYLIWILDDFDIHSQNTLEKDIKYLTKYENFFKLDEKSETLKLECEYKFTFLTNENELHSKWLKKSVSLSEMKFDETIFQAYYYNFGDNKKKKELEQIKINEEAKLLERKEQEEQRHKASETKIENILQGIIKTRKVKYPHYSSFSDILNEINFLTHSELELLNSKISLKSKEAPIIKWIEQEKDSDYYFLDFIISCEKIEKDINEATKDGKTVYQAIIENEKLIKVDKIKLFKKLLEYKYRLTESDNQILHNYLSDNKNLLLFTLCNKLKNRKLTPQVFENSQLLFIIESAVCKQLVGYRYQKSKWIQLANYAIANHTEYWDYIEATFKYYDIWEMIEKEDKKETFSKKLQKYYSEMPKQSYVIDELIGDLYPDIFIL